ncbi:MAG: IS200/IS605 family transposase [Bacteroidota bacterium]|jgi:putative transposase
MANTYTQLYAHVVFAVKGRENLISHIWKNHLYKYITGIITHKKQKLMIVNGMPNHIHLLIGFNPDCNLSDLVRDVKSNSSKWINENKLAGGKFQWQNGFGAFTVGHSQIQTVVNYIKNQEEHHKVDSFRDEYIGLLKSYEIDFRTDFIFDDIGAAPPEL